MTYQLSDGVTYCVVDELVVFHDLRSDVYISLKDVESRGFRLFAATGKAADGDLFADLASAGLLKSSEADFVPFGPVRSVLPETSYLDHAPKSVTALEVVSAVLAQYATAIALRFWPLHSIIATLRPHRVESRLISNRQTIRAVEQAARAFDLSTRVIGSSTKCLRRSIALHKHLSRQGIETQLVIGVKVNAFGAHCWVQHSKTVLNDSLENVLRYTPIFIA